MRIEMSRYQENTLPGVDFKAHSCEVAPPNVPSHPLLVSVHPGFIVQHIPSFPHHSQGPCTALHSSQHPLPSFSISELYSIVKCTIMNWQNVVI